MRLTSALIYLFLATMLCSLTSSAEILRTLAYQGVLTDTLGNPKPDGSYGFTFRLYGAASGGSALWSETKTLEVKKGLFSTLLGDQTAFGAGLKFNTQYWLTLQVGSDPELSPRIFLSTVGYSLNSRTADTAAYAREAPPPDFVDSARIARTVPDASITSAKIQNGTIQFADIAQNGATSGQVMKWNGSAWAAAADAAGGGTGGWTDDGTIVNLVTSTDTVAINSTSRLGKLNVGGDIGMTGLSPTLFFGSDLTRITGQTGDMRLVAEDLSALTTGDISFGHFGDETWIKFDNANKRVGIGTLSVADRFHVANDNASAACWMRVESSHPTNWGQAGLRIKTPQNMWNLRMDLFTNANLPDGALSLYSQDGAKEAMTWLENGNVGVGTINPARKLHVYGSAQVKDTLYASAVNASKIVNGPGLANTVVAGPLSMGADPSVIASVTIAVPSAGYTLISSCAAVHSLHHTYGDFTECSFRLSTNTTTTGQFAMTSWSVDENCPSGVYSTPFALQGVQQVSSAGSYTYYLLGKRAELSGHDAITVYDICLTAVFVPNAYGTVDLASASSEPPVEQNVNTAKDQVETLESRVARLSDELVAVRRELESKKK
jgi:hypothetical protein